MRDGKAAAPAGRRGGAGRTQPLARAGDTPSARRGQLRRGPISMLGSTRLPGGQGRGCLSATEGFRAVAPRRQFVKTLAAAAAVIAAMGKSPQARAQSTAAGGKKPDEKAAGNAAGRQDVTHPGRHGVPGARGGRGGTGQGLDDHVFNRGKTRPNLFPDPKNCTATATREGRRPKAPEGARGTMWLTRRATTRGWSRPRRNWAGRTIASGTRSCRR